MEIGVQRTDSQRSQSNNNGNGPRVSFNKDVHVKRIGRPQPEQPQLSFRRELPENLSQEQILKEAEFVLAQAEKVNCHADRSDIILNAKVINDKQRQKLDRRKVLNDTNKFNSLPSRKKRAKSKPVERSVSDASSKKQPAAKKSTIFNLFSRKSDTNLDEIDKTRDRNNNTNINSNTRSNNNNSSSNNKRVGRSKSDVGVTKESRDTIRQALQQRKRNNSESDDLGNLTLSNKRRTNSNQLSPIIEVSTPREEFFTDPPNLQNHDDNIITFNPISDSVKDAILTLSNTKLNSKSTEDMHSSQQPQSKPPLTKGLTVDGMVKRLSMERFSPPPHFTSPAFSYTRSPPPIITNDNQINHNPNGNVIYAQVVCDDNGKNKQTVHSTLYDAQRSRSPAYPAHNGTHHSSQKFNKSHDEIDGMNHHVNGNYHNQSSSHHHNHHQQHYTASYTPPQDSYKTKILISENRNPSSKVHQHHHQHNHHYSDEDEGLGFEIKRGVEDESLISTREEEITPKIRDVPPEKPLHITQISHHRGRADGMDAFFPEFQELSDRRKMLESRIQSRRIGSREILDETSPERDFYKNPLITPERLNERNKSPVPREYRSKSYDPYLDPNETNDKFHKLNKTEITTRYSPQRSHLDMVASTPKSTVTSSKVVRETKYYQDEHGDGVRETYNSETQIDKDGRPITKEYRIKEKTRPGHQTRDVIDLGYIEDHRDYNAKYNTNEVIDPNLNYFQTKYRAVHEPKSLDSQYSDQNRSSPEEQHEITVKHNNKHIINKVENNKYTATKMVGSAGVKPYPDYYQDSLKRHKKHQRSFDKGDSGIENDYRKDSFNGEFHSKWKKRTFIDDIKASDQFLRKERKHTDETAHVPPRKLNNSVIYHRERSIDDGSHFDPRLDKYAQDTSTLRKSGKLTTSTRNHSNSAELLNGKVEKKISGLEKVKQLLTGTGKKKQTKKNETDKKDAMMHEEDLRARYKEYRSADVNEVKTNDISTRRRLSTPKASPLPSQKSSSNESTAQKLGWFKSIDRLSRKKSLSTAPSSKVETISSTTSIAQPIDETDDVFPTNLKMKPKSTTTTPSKNLRFFGDTDIESNPSLSKAAWKPKSRHSIASSSNLSQPNNKKYSKSSYELDKIPSTTAPNHSQTLKHSKPSKLKSERSKSVSMQQLHAPRRSGSRENDRYDYSASDDEQHDRENHRKSYDRSPAPQRHELNESDNEDDVPFEQKRYLFEESYRKAAEDYQNRSKSRERSLSPPVNKARDFKKPPPGPPPKPARVIDRRRGMSKEPLDRIQDSSGTEGDSSQLSQRSVVYLHATTVGEIPQPYILNTRRKAVSRDDLTSSSYRTAPNRKLTPMTKTVSRSVSVLAPWKPKHIRDGYEINYSQSNEKAAKKYHSSARQENDQQRRHLTSSQSTLTRPKKEASTANGSSTLSRTSKSKTRSKDDVLAAERSVPKTTNGTLSRSHGKEKRILETVEVHNHHSNKENSSGRKWN